MVWIIFGCAVFWAGVAWLASHALWLTGLVFVVALAGCTLACALAAVSAEAERRGAPKGSGEEHLTVVRFGSR